MDLKETYYYGLQMNVEQAGAEYVQEEADRRDVTVEESR